MSIYELGVEDLNPRLRSVTTVVEDSDALNRLVAAEFADLLQEKTARGETMTMIAPVGPLDYRFFAEEVRRRRLTCRNLRVVNMDEYLADDGTYVPYDHPLSFHRFMEETFYGRLSAEERPLPENVLFPDPRDPGATTRLFQEIGGADICWAGFGLTGHVAFNDPPLMLGEPDDVESLRNCKTRKLTISPMSTAQMLMGGVNGNYAILPTRAVTVGMYEMLKSKRFHCAFMRNWHAGLWRRAFLDAVTAEFPGSLLQEHPNLTITMTELAAAVPVANTAQATGEET